MPIRAPGGGPAGEPASATHLLPAAAAAGLAAAAAAALGKPQTLLDRGPGKETAVGCLS